jgi:hypothetical protein
MPLLEAFRLIADGYTFSVILAMADVLTVCWAQLSVRLDPKEPPLLKPKIPRIGKFSGP